MGARLTYNFARRGGFSIYFWKVRRIIDGLKLKLRYLFSHQDLLGVYLIYFFICLYQMGLIFLFSLPILAAWQGSEPLGMMDYIIGSFMFLLIVIQYISDQQQYDFQTEKYRRIENNEKLDGDYKEDLSQQVYGLFQGIKFYM